MIKFCYKCNQIIIDEDPIVIKPKGVKQKTKYYHQKCIKELIKEWQDVSIIQSKVY